MTEFRVDDEVMIHGTHNALLNGKTGRIAREDDPKSFYDWYVQIEEFGTLAFRVAELAHLDPVERKRVADITEDTTVTYFKSLDDNHWSLCYEDEIEDSLRRGYAVKKYTMYRKYTVEILGSHDG